MKIFKNILIAVSVIVISTFVLQSVALAADNFSSGGNVTPEKDVYYVGDIVSIYDLFKNKSGSTATSVSVEYYYRLDGSNSVYSGSPINFGTVAAGKSETYTFSYTFKESDIGDYRIGAKITYTMGGSTYSEYSSGHDFIVEQAPTPTPAPTDTMTPAPTDTPTPVPTAEPTFTPEPTATPEPTIEKIETFTPDPTDVPATKTPTIQPTKNPEVKALLEDRRVVMMLIIIVGLILVLMIILIIVLVSKKK